MATDRLYPSRNEFVSRGLKRCTSSSEAVVRREIASSYNVFVPSAESSDPVSYSSVPCSESFCEKLWSRRMVEKSSLPACVVTKLYCPVFPETGPFGSGNSVRYGTTAAFILPLRALGDKTVDCSDTPWACRNPS